MDFIGNLLASPLETALPELSSKPEATRMLAWKVGLDQKKGWMTFVRIYTGKQAKVLALWKLKILVQERFRRTIHCIIPISGNENVP